MRYLIALLSITLALFAKEVEITPNQVKTPGGSILPYTIDDGVKVFHLKASPVRKEIFNSKINLLTPAVLKHNRYTGPEDELPFKTQFIDGLGYNNSIPGPTIVVCEGDRVKFIVENGLSEPTTVHWHGLIVPNNEDGSGGTDDPVIKPGKTGVYEFTIVNPPGTYGYHSGFNDAIQVGSGLSGAFVVLPKDGKDQIPNDFVIELQGWDAMQNGKISPLSMNNNWFTYNGICAPNFPVLKVQEGERVRIRFVNLGGIVAHPIHLHGYSFMITGTEGGPIQPSAQWPAATVAVAPGTTRDIEFIANNPGLWRMHCHILHHIINDHPYYEKIKNPGIIPNGGMLTYLEVIPRTKSD